MTLYLNNMIELNEHKPFYGFEFENILVLPLPQEELMTFSRLRLFKMGKSLAKITILIPHVLRRSGILAFFLTSDFEPIRIHRHHTFFYNIPDMLPRLLAPAIFRFPDTNLWFWRALP